MKPVLHGIGLSPYVRKVRFALAFKGIEYDLEPVIPRKTPEGFEKISQMLRHRRRRQHVSASQSAMQAAAAASAALTQVATLDTVRDSSERLLPVAPSTAPGVLPTITS